jgi:protein gp37
VPNHPFEQGFDVRVVPDKLMEPLRWKSPRKVFVNSMSDLFHEKVPDDFIVDVAKVMKKANWHIFQVLTKREKRLEEMLRGALSQFAVESHIWWGVSVENRKHGLPRLRALQRSNAKIKFLSVEPLIEDLGEIDLSGIAWVIVGGESGPGARPMRPEWVRAIRDQCRLAQIPFFFKQWGGARKHLTGRTLDREVHNSFPEVSARLPADRRHFGKTSALNENSNVSGFIPIAELTGL